MSNNILDQAEIDALLNAAQAEDDSEDGDGSQVVNIKPYAFQPPDLISRTQFRGLTALHEEFSREMQASLSLLLRTRVELRLLSVEQQRFVDFATSLAEITNIHMFDAKPLSGTGLVDFSMPVIFGILDHQLGGDGTAELPNRTLTAVELAIIEPILQLFFRTLQDTLGKEVPVEIQRGRTESNAEYAHIAQPAAPVVTVCIDVEIGAVNGLVHICYPAPMVASVLWEQQGTAVGIPEAKDDGPEAAENRKLILSSMMEIPIEVPVVLGEAQLSAEQWVAIKVGDVLVLPQRVSDPVLVKAENQPLFYARPGRVGRMRSVRILRPALDAKAPEITDLYN